MRAPQRQVAQDPETDAPAEEAWATMLEHHIRHLPVTADDALIGIVTERELRLVLRPGVEPGDWKVRQVCAEDAQYTYALNFTGRGFHTSIGTFFDKAMPQTTCVFCGQCVGVCPTGALKGKREYLLEQGVAPEAIFQQTRPPRRAGPDAR